MTTRQNVLFSLSSGCILMIFSEFFFYGEVSPGAQWNAALMLDLLLLLVIYSLLAYVLHTLVRAFHIHSIAALFLAGAFLGWLLEGVIVTTVYENFPWQIHFTALTWHAPLDVLVGWHLLPKVMRKASPWPTLFASAASGLFWGTWVIWRWWEEGVPLSPERFAVFTLIATLLLAIAYGTLTRVDGHLFRRSTRATRGLGFLLCIWFGLNVLPQYPWAPLIIIPLFLITGYALRQYGRLEIRPDLLNTFAQPLPWKRIVLLFLLPLTAAISYTLLVRLGARFPINAIVYVLTSLGAIFAFLFSLRTLLCMRERMPAKRSSGQP